MATFAFALIPQDFIWLIMGGGITRSFGFLFAILAISRLKPLLDSQRRGDVILLGLFSGLSLLSHLEFAVFVAFSCLLFWLRFSRERRGILAIAQAALVAIGINAPWFSFVIIQHGIGPIIAAGRTGDNPIEAASAILQYTTTGELLFPVLAALSLLGLYVCWTRRDWLLPLWLLMCLFVDFRAGKVYVGVPVALLVSIGIVDGLLPLAKRWDRPQHGGGATTEPKGLLVAIFLYAGFASLLLPPGYLSPLPQGERTAMQWVAVHTPPSGRFLVVGGAEAPTEPGGLWTADRSAEWFPALTGRQSVGTYEGHEWLGDYSAAHAKFDEVLSCMDRGADCLTQWGANESVAFDYVYVPKGAGEDSSFGSHWCCWSLRNSLRADPLFAVIYDGPGATIAARRTSASLPR